MGCLLVVLGLATPRFIIVILWIFTDYLSRAFQTFWWPLLGFFILPTTTIAYAIAQNSLHGELSKVVVLVLGVFIDVGIIGRGRGALRVRGE